MPNPTKDDNQSERVKILAFGEILWDMLPSGKKLGGAPVNFLYHASTVGADVRALTRIGKDALGEEIFENVKRLNLSTELLQIDPEAQTGVVEVSLDANGTPSYQIVQNVAWDNIEIDDETSGKIENFFAENAPSALCFGSLALRTANNARSFRSLLELVPSAVKRFCDLNLRAPFYSSDVVSFAMQAADVFKLNDDEALELDSLFGVKTIDPSFVEALKDPNVRAKLVSCAAEEYEVKRAFRDWATYWQERCDIETIVLTCGANGAFIFSRTETQFAPSEPTIVKDSVGAGDAFAAICAVGLLRNVPLQTIVQAASKRAAFVCAQDGGTPRVPKELLDPFGAR